MAAGEERALVMSGALAAPALADRVEGFEPAVAAVRDAGGVADENYPASSDDAIESFERRLGIEPMNRAADRDGVENADALHEGFETALDHSGFGIDADELAAEPLEADRQKPRYYKTYVQCIMAEKRDRKRRLIF
jgi:hypothetical protein